MATTWKDPVKVATTQDLGSPPSIPSGGKIDGVTLAVGDRVLVKDQANSAENGIYEVQADPLGGPQFVLARPAGEVVKAGDAVLVSERHTILERWALGATEPITVGTTGLPWGRREPVFNVLDFGADPSGTSDSWQAFKAWSTAISNAGGGVGLVPSGTYTIDRVVEKAGSWDGPENFRFEGCKGLWLIGYGATLNLKGDITLEQGNPVYDENGNLVNYETSQHMICPFFIYDCANVCIEGFEVNGQADLVDFNGIIEAGGHCVYITNSKHVTIRHMHIHHGWTDGISVRAADSGYLDRLTCRHVVIENCEIHDNVRACIGVHETRHLRIANCRLYNSGMGIDIEPDAGVIELGIEPDALDPTPDVNRALARQNRFTLIENCEIYRNESPLTVGVRYSQVRVQGCFIDNQRQSRQPVVLSVPQCTLLDSEIDTGTGHIDVALSGSLPGNNVFTMERCLIRSHTAMVNGVLTTGEGLFIAPDPTAKPDRIMQALIANNRFINESSEPWFPFIPEEGERQDNGARFPNLSHGDLMLLLTFRDNYVFIPQVAYHGQGGGMSAITMHVHLAENNVYDTDLPGEVGFFDVFYGSGVSPKFGVLVRNERFLSAGDGSGFRPADNSTHVNIFPYSQGVNAVGGELNLGEPAGSQRVLFAPGKPTSGVFQQGDLIFNSRAAAGQPMGWICTIAGDLGGTGLLSDLPNVM